MQRLLIALTILNLLTQFTCTKDYETEYYTQLPDKCENEKCVTFSHFSFEYIWDKYPLEEAIEEFNEVIEEGRLGYIPNKIAAVYDKEENRMKLIAKSDLPLGTLLADSAVSDLLVASGRINWELFSTDSEIQKTIKGLGKLKQQQFDDKFMNLLYFILNILAHLHNIEESALKAEILVLPRSIDFPAYSLTDYEIDLIKTDGLNGEVLGSRYSIQQSFKGFQQIIHQSFTKKQLNILFNGHKILEQDFVYAYTLIFFFSPKNQWILKGFVSSVKHNPKQQMSPVKGIQEKGQSRMKIYTSSDYSVGNTIKFNICLIGEEIKTDILPLPLKFLVNEFPDEKIDDDCQPVFLLGKEQARLYKHDEQGCLSNETLFHYYALMNLINMNAQQYGDCIKILKHKLKKAYSIVVNKFKDQAIFDYCVHPKLDKTNDILSFGAKQYEERLDGYNFRYKKAQEYEEFREEQNLSTTNAKLIIKYLKHKRLLTKELIKEIHRYGQINEMYADTVKKVYDFGEDEFPDLENYVADDSEKDLENELIQDKDKETGTATKKKKKVKKESLELEERDEL